MQSGVNESSLYISNKPGLMHLCKCVLAVLFVFLKGGGGGGKWGVYMHLFMQSRSSRRRAMRVCHPRGRMRM